MFKHFLITRFNLRKADWSTNKKNVAVLTEEWHENRFELFTNYCFPSVKAQTNNNFLWLVFFDTTTPEKYKKVVAELQKEMENFVPLFIDGMDLFLPSIKDYIKNYKEEYIITSGLDNDDCLSNLYVDEVQKRFNNQSFMALDFIDGYTIQTQSHIKVGKKLHQYNPFISLIEKNENPRTVCDVSHRIWKKEKRILQVRNVRTWSSVIHHENKVNEFTGFGKVNIKKFFDQFIISEKQRIYIETNYIPVSKWKLQSLINYCDDHWKFKVKNLKKSLGFYKG
ncbi:MAG: putative rhamnosyl transferase [Flavobacteriaceae bacterium]|nr:putative rhamnosyl transferase [Flavobacteriaceae bacterium]